MDADGLDLRSPWGLKASPFWFLQSSDAEGVKLVICTEKGQIVLDRVRSDHPIKRIKRISMHVLESRSTYHGLWLQREKRISEATLYIDDQVALELDRLGELAVPYFQTDLVDGRR
jgi:hypothetical protein